MAGRESAATQRGLALMAQGLPLRTAAAQAGVSKTTLVEARKRAGLPPLPKGRPPSKQAA